MKKLFLIFSIIASFSGSAQNKFVNATIDTSGNVVATYINNLGTTKIINIKGLNSSLLTQLRDSISIIPTAIANVTCVTFLTTGTPSQGTFTIIGEHFTPMQLKVSQLTGNHTTLANNFISLVQNVQSKQLTSCTAPFHTESLTINGIVYNSTTLNTQAGGLLDDLIQMFTDIFNGATP